MSETGQNEIGGELTSLIKSDPRLSYFKKGIEDRDKTEETLLRIILVYAKKYFCDYYGDKNRKLVWKEIVDQERIEGVRLNPINSPNDNQLTGLVKAARLTVKNPIYEIQDKYQYIKATVRLAEKFNLRLETKEEKERFPKILVVPHSYENSNPYILKKELAERAISGLKKYLKDLNARPGSSYLALTGGTAVLRFVNKFLSELDEDPTFKNNLEKMSPIKIVEISDPQELTNFGLLENTRSLHLALCDMKLASSGDYVPYGKFDTRKETLQAVYTGIGKPPEVSSPASNNPLLNKFKDLNKKLQEKASKFLFEVNAIPYYEDLDFQKEIRNKLNTQLIALEELNSKNKIILCPGRDKERAIYNLIVYSLNNPKHKVATHIIIDNVTFIKVLRIAEENSAINQTGKNYQYSYEEESL